MSKFGLRSSRSLIAGANALFRMAESRRAAPERILEDPWAHQLADTHLLIQGIRFARFGVPPLARMIDQLQLAHCVRHHAIDELVLAAVERDGFRQVVVLGAGYDMRPHRFAERLADVRWIEVDLRPILDRKQRLLRGAALDGPAVVRVAADVSRDPLADDLLAAGYAPGEPTCFVLEGLVHYLTREQLDALLREIAGGDGARRVVLSFIRSDMYASAPSLFVRLVLAVREVPRLHFEPDELAALLARSGLGEFRNWSFTAQVDAFAPEAASRTAGVSQDVAEASRGAKAIRSSE